MERARQEPEGQFRSLAHLIDVECLERAYHRLRADAAVGVDGVSKEQYGQELRGNLEDLHRRMKAMQYRHQPILRVHVPKETRGTRPIGISAIEDKVVQGALTEVLTAIYEQDFLTCSFGFRPRRSAHDAIRVLNEAIHRAEVHWILEADIKSFFDSVNRRQLEEMLQIRVADGSLLRLIGKCLHVGVLEGEEFSRPDEGTPQGSVISPILGNVYLHYVLDLWFEQDIRPRLAGRALLVRYADDFVMGFERQDDAERVMAVLGKRLAKFGLTLHPDKTRLMPFGRPPKEHQKGKGPGTFDFLGFTFYWARNRWGKWNIRCKTRRARLGRAIRRVYSFCRGQRHQPVAEQHSALTSRIRGHFNYFGVNGNIRSLCLLVRHAERAWLKWLCRRSQRSRLNWKRFKDLLKDFPLPRPRVFVQIWGAVP
jgi:group II intron reverse transcriptase/maturase